MPGRSGFILLAKALASINKQIFLGIVYITSQVQLSISSFTYSLHYRKLCLEGHVVIPRGHWKEKIVPLR